MSNIEAVIFDWAGTTVDFGSMAPVQAFMEAFKSEGIEPTLEEIRKPMGMLKRDHVKTMMSMDRIHKLWLETKGHDWTETDVDRVYEKSEKGIIDIVENFAAPKPYVLETIAALKAMNIKIGSTTGYTDAMMSIVVPKAAAQGYTVDAWYTPEAVENYGRPYPYMIYKNLQALHVSAVSAAIKIGDTVADIKEGKNAGLITIGIVEGSSVMGLTETEFEALTLPQYRAIYTKTAQVFQEAGADYILPNLSALIPLIKTLNQAI